MRVTIRTAGTGDVDAIVAFGSAVVPQYYTPILGEKAAHAQLAWWTRERISPALQAGRLHVAIAADREVVGVCQTGELSEDQVIWKLYLAAEYRGRSLGAELLCHAVASLPEGVDHVDVEHFAGNAGAARFYEREGFTVIRTDPAPSGESSSSAIVWRRLQLP
jgi:ribosomal protein S18 acetylase RimI-like enzyme